MEIKDLGSRSASFIDMDSCYISRYVNKKGGPDKRFKNNPEILICLYDGLHFSSASDINEVIQVSKSGIGANFSGAVKNLADLDLAS